MTFLSLSPHRIDGLSMRLQRYWMCILAPHRNRIDNLSKQLIIVKNYRFSPHRIDGL